MSTSTDAIEELATREYKYGFVTDVEAEELPPGLNEDIVRRISAKKNEPAWMLEWRLKAFRVWQTMTEPTWQNVHYKPIDYQDIIYYSAPKPKKALASMDEVDPEVRKTFEKLGIPLEEQKLFSGVAVDAVFGSVSVGTTFKAKLAGGTQEDVFYVYYTDVQKIIKAKQAADISQYVGTVKALADVRPDVKSVFNDGDKTHGALQRAIGPGERAGGNRKRHRNHRRQHAHADHRADPEQRDVTKADRGTGGLCDR